MTHPHCPKSPIGLQPIGQPRQAASGAGRFVAAETTATSAWVFAKTRVPVRSLFENLEDGAAIEELVEWFPGVTRKQVEAVLDFVPTIPDTLRRREQMYCIPNPPESTAT